MVLAIKGARDIFKRSPEDSQFDIYEGQKKIPSSPTSGGTGVVPIGAILAHAQDIAGCPAIPAEFQKCDGSAISDAASPMDGENTPDLNGGEFLRGDATSGGTGGADTMAHTHTTNVSVNNHTSLAMNNHSALAMNNHSALAVNAHSNHDHDVGGTTGAGSTHHHDISTALAVGSGGLRHINVTQSNEEAAHTHSFADTSTSVGLSAHAFGTNISAHSFGTNISNHSWGQNISNHSVNNPASDAASNTENRPKYFNVVWIIRIK